jgi:hypothetical protein
MYVYIRASVLLPPDNRTRLRRYESNSGGLDFLSPNESNLHLVPHYSETPLAIEFTTTLDDL